MAKRIRPNPADFSVAELKSMLAAKADIGELEARRNGLLKELDKVEIAIAKLLAGVNLSKKPSRKKAAKKTGVRRVAKKKATKKKAAKKTSKKAVSRKTAKKASSTKPRPTIESVIVDLLTKNGEPMAFKDILVV